MNVFAVMTLAEPENSRWLSELEDILWAICDEYAWALPAHIPADQPARDAARNLEWTETAFVLDLTAAYGVPGVTVQRACTFLDGKLQVEDTFTGCKDKEITERFVTRILPEQSDTCFSIAGWAVTADRPCTTTLHAGFHTASELLQAGQHERNRNRSADGLSVHTGQRQLDCHLHRRKEITT